MLNTLSRSPPHFSELKLGDERLLSRVEIVRLGVGGEDFLPMDHTTNDVEYTEDHSSVYTCTTCGLRKCEIKNFNYLEGPHHLEELRAEDSVRRGRIGNGPS